MSMLPHPPPILRDPLLLQAREREERRTMVRRDEEEELPAPPVVVQHLNVSCDECGELPIVGTRYKSRIQPNYDVCQGCLEENHNGDDAEFDTLVRYRPSVATTAIRRSGGSGREMVVGRSVSIHSLYELESQLQDDSVEDVAFYVGTRLTCPQLGATVRRVLKQTKSLKSVHIHIFGTEYSTATIVALAEGLQENTSALSVSWNLLWNRHDPPLDARAATALQSLMETNTTMQYMFVHRQRGFGIHPPTNNNINNNTGDSSSTSNTGEEEEEQDPLADAIFEALAKTHLHTVRYSGTSPVQPHNQKKAWAAMIANPHLKRVKTVFASTDPNNSTACSSDNTIDTTSSQEYLELLQTDKKHCWLQRWTGFATDNNSNDNELGVSEQERQESQKRWKVLQEVLDTQDLDKKVPVLYHLLRNQPECLMRVQLPILLNDNNEEAILDDTIDGEEEEDDVLVSMMEDIASPMEQEDDDDGKEQEEEQFQLDLEDDGAYDNLIWV